MHLVAILSLLLATLEVPLVVVYGEVYGHHWHSEGHLGAVAFLGWGGQKPLKVHRTLSPRGSVGETRAPVKVKCRSVADEYG